MAPRMQSYKDKTETCTNLNCISNNKHCKYPRVVLSSLGQTNQLTPYFRFHSISRPNLFSTIQNPDPDFRSQLVRISDPNSILFLMSKTFYFVRLYLKPHLPLAIHPHNAGLTPVLFDFRQQFWTATVTLARRVNDLLSMNSR